MAEKFFAWTEKYSVGVRILDYDHQELFQLVNDLHDAIEQNEGQKHLVVIVTALIRYVNEHFDREEQIMAEYNCPDLAEHQRHHHDFLRLIYAIRIVLSAAPGRISPVKLLKLLRGWLHNHVLGDDQQYARYITAGYGRRKVDLTERLSEKTDDPVSPSDSELSDKDAVLVTVQIQVPADKVATLRRCALLLRLNGEPAVEIERMTDPLTSMTEQEALDLARIVLA